MSNRVPQGYIWWSLSYKKRAITKKRSTSWGSGICEDKSK